MRRGSRFLLTVGLAWLLSGCGFSSWVYAPPQVAVPAAIEDGAEGNDRATGNLGEQTFGTEVGQSARWWTAFQNPRLDALIEQSLKRHPSVESAEAALREAEADLGASTGQLTVPQVNLNGSISRTHINNASFGGTAPFNGSFNLFNAGLSITYTPDLFGSIGTALAALGAKVDVSQENLEAARLNLAGNIAMAAIKEAALKEQHADILTLIELQNELVGLTLQRQQLGAVGQTDLLAAQTQEDTARALLPPVEKALGETRHLLLSLSGQTSGLKALPEFTLSEFNLPMTLPKAVPAELLHSRPDIRGAEAAMRAANAAVGVADANLYPSLSITGNLGGSANRVSDLFKQDASLWNLGSNLVAPLLNGGSLKAKKASAEAAYKVVQADYRDTVIKSIQSVADILVAIETDAMAEREQTKLIQTALSQETLAKATLLAGAGTRQQVISASAALLQAKINAVQTKANRFLDTIMFYQALGIREPSKLTSPSSTGSSS